MAVVTLGIISWATPLYGEAVARTMGVVAFSLTNIWFALETADEEKSVFSSETLQNPTLLKAAGIAFLFTILATELKITNTILDTVNLTVQQWMIGIRRLACGARHRRGEEAPEDPDDDGAGARDDGAGVGRRLRRPYAEAAPDPGAASSRPKSVAWGTGAAGREPQPFRVRLSAPRSVALHRGDQGRERGRRLLTSTWPRACGRSTSPGS